MKLNHSMLVIAAVSAAAIAPSFASAQEKTFKVVDGRLAYRNLASVESETEFETFTGKTTAVTGSIKFDPKKKTGSGSVAVAVDGIDTGIPGRNDHLKGAQWLDAAKHPSIKFVTTSVRSLGGDKYQVKGKFTMKGVTKDITTTATLRYRAAGEATKAAGFDGDVAQILTRFNIKLSDYGVVIPAPAKGKVANDVSITLSAYAVAN